MLEKQCNIQEEYISQTELKKIFGFGRDKMKRFLNSGLLPVVKLNKNYYITRAQLDKWFQQNAGKKIEF